MATRTILSPGVEIREKDLSLVAPNNVGTGVFVTGFADQGPIDEVLQVSSREELELYYGVPTNSAERYFYHTVRELLNSPARIYTSRLPYGAGTGTGFGSKYSALVFPGVATADGTSTSSTFAITSGSYILGTPYHFELTQDEYTSVIDGSGFTWSATPGQLSSFNSVNSFGGAAVIVLNKAQTTINDQFEGYYLGISDNLFNNPGVDYNAIRSVKTVNTSVSVAPASSYVTIPEGTLQFTLTSSYVNGPVNSISQIIENIADYDISSANDSDLLSLGVFKLRKSLFATESFKLDYVLEDRIVGSIDYYRSTTSPASGPAINYFLGAVDNDSRNVEILVNDTISNRLSNTSIGIDGVPKKKIRVLTTTLLTQNVSADSGVSTSLLSALSSSSVLGLVDSIYPLGAYNGAPVLDKVLGDIPSKLDRALDGVRNEDIYDIDVIPEAGLGTIYAASSGAQTAYYDEFNYTTALAQQISGLRTSSAADANGQIIRNNYTTIFNKFANFCSPPYDGGGRGDCIFVADPIRQIYVTGVNNKVASNKNSIFQRDIYWATRHQFENVNTSYATVYANWAKVYDSFIGQQVWVPFSGFAAASMARTDANTFPWFAPAGFENGLVTGAIDIAVAPNQKQRDELYRTNLNPVTFFPAQGQVIFGQKTLSRKPSAFDRINVRRLFLALERPTRKAAQFFVFQPNTTFTRTRLVNTLTPIFDRAKNNQGLYDYLIVCDERNNTPQVIDNNELVVDIYIKPVRTAEFILINFVATRTDANFQEIIGA